MHWADIGSLHFLWLVPLMVIFYIFVFRSKRKSLEKYARIDILPKLLPYVSFKRQYFKSFLLIATVIFLIISLARPQYGVKEELVTHRGVDIMLAIDTSDSMKAEDIQPSRLEKVKLSVRDLLDKLQGDRVGLIAFSGESILNCPLTIDYGAINMLVDILDTNIVQEPGTNIEKAIELARKAFNSKERLYKVLIIITDGENHMGDPLSEAKKAAKEGIRVYTIGIGTSIGAPIPSVKSEKGTVLDTKKDISGKEVITRLDENILKEIAEAGGGKYIPVNSRGDEIEEIVAEISGMEKKEFQSKFNTNYIERFQYPLFLAFILLICEFMLDSRARTSKKWSGRFE